MQDSPLGLLASAPFGLVVAGLWGALWGSFLNVVIERLPRGESLLRPASHCLACQSPIRWYDNVPLLSYLLLRGRCRRCGARYSARYLLVEALGLGLALLCFHHAVLLGVGTPAERLAGFLVEFTFALGLLAIVFIDLRTMIIPDLITLPSLLVLAPAAVALGRVDWKDATLGAAVGFGSVWLLREIWFRLRGQEGIGLGDGKLLALVGGVLGWQALPAVLLLGSVQGLLVAVPLRLLGRSLLATEAYQGTGVRAAGEPPREADPAAAGGAAVPVASSSEPPAEAAPSEPAPLRHLDAPSGEGPEAATAAQTAAEYDVEYDEVPAGAVPFGPFLAVAAVEVLLFGEALSKRMSWLLDALFGGP